MDADLGSELVSTRSGTSPKRGDIAQTPRERLLIQFLDEEVAAARDLVDAIRQGAIMADNDDLVGNRLRNHWRGDHRLNRRWRADYRLSHHGLGRRWPR